MTRAPGGSRGPGDASSSEDEEALSTRHIRGSSLLLAGRVGSMAVKLAAQVLIVRHLSTGDFGAWSYALAAAVFFRGFATVGLNRTLPRFLAIHLEREEYSRFWGTLLLVLGTLLATTGLVVAAFHAFPQGMTELAGQGPEALHVLFIIVLLVPLEALDDFLTGLLATFSRSRTIFLRRYVLSPMLLLTAAIALVVLDGDVRFLAHAYVGAILLGILYYGWSAVRVLAQEGLLGKLKGRILLPVREVFGYTAPLMTSDWVGTLLVSMGPLALGYVSDLDAVAIYRVVVPLVAVSEVVRRTFVLLFRPTASRLFARGDFQGLEALYWRTAAFVAVLGFPAFAVLFVAAEPLTVLFFGERYLPSAAVLSLLVVGHQLASVMGPNNHTLKVVGRVGWVVVINVATVLVTLAFHGLLVPAYGVVGAGVATTASLGVHHGLYHLALHRLVGLRPFPGRYLRPYLAMAAAFPLLVLVRLAAPADVWVQVATVVLTSTAVFMAARPSLELSATFPEAARFRLVRALLG